MNDTINLIQERNARVEADKAWETSKTRRCLIAVMTYVIAFFYMYVLGVQYAALNALIPTGGFLLSTLSLRIAKKYWLENLYDQKVVS